jgi:uncharacterized RDD family membrane protein YckC
VGIYVVAIIIAAILGVVSHGLFVLFEVIGGVATLVWYAWLAVQIGQTGQSPGMRVIGLKAVRKDNGQLIGTGLGVARWLVHVVLGFLCFIGAILDYLWPFWDREKQTLADKAVSSVVLVVPKQAFSLQPPASPPAY